MTRWPTPTADVGQVVRLSVGTLTVVSVSGDLVRATYTRDGSGATTTDTYYLPDPHPTDRTHTMSNHDSIRFPIHHYEPGDGTRYDLLVVPVSGDTFGLRSDPHALVYVNGNDGGKVFTFDASGFIMWTYLAEHMALSNHCAINALLGYIHRHTGVAVGLMEGFGWRVSVAIEDGDTPPGGWVDVDRHILAWGRDPNGDRYSSPLLTRYADAVNLRDAQGPARDTILSWVRP